MSSAVEALAPPQPLQEDFAFHWKAITSYFMENRDSKMPVEETNIPTHLQNMLTILLHEESSDESGTTGPCMEYLLRHKLLETLYTLGRADCPSGMKQRVLVFFTSMLAKVRQPLLPHVSVFKAVHKLIRMCGEVKASPTENEEILFLCTVCAKLKENPHVVSFFLEEQKNNSTATSSSQSQFCLVDSLLAMTHSADSRVAVKACEGLILCTSLNEENGAIAIVNTTKFCEEVTRWLGTTYASMPRSADPSDIEYIDARWGMDSIAGKDGPRAFPGQRQTVAFFCLVDYCDQLIKEAHPVVGRALASAIRRVFLRMHVRPHLLKEREVEYMAAMAYLNRVIIGCTAAVLLDELSVFVFEDDIAGVNGCSPVASTAALADLTGEPQSRSLSSVLVERCHHQSDEVAMVSLKLFDSLLQRPSHVTVNVLLLRYLADRRYLLPLPSSPTATTDDPPRSALTSAMQQPPGATSDERLVPSESPTHAKVEDEDKLAVTKIVNHFLGLVPDEVKSSFDSADGAAYDSYLHDAHRQFADINLLCSGWPAGMTPSISTDSNKEVEPPLQDGTATLQPFDEGPFLRILFQRLSSMMQQSYEFNLQLTSVVAKLALLPPPSVHEFLLNPFLPTAEDTQTLCKTFDQVRQEIAGLIRDDPSLHAKVIHKRKQLLGVFGLSSELSPTDERVTSGMIVFEEFCKELAAIAFVKHHFVSF